MVIGILHTGELGAAVGARLVASGEEVVTVAGRSEATARRARDAGVRIVDEIGGVVEGADLLVSLVVPGAAVELARQVRDAGPGRDGQLFVDANSIAPETVRAIVSMFDSSPTTVVDATVHGLASRLASDGTMYVSGPGAERVQSILGRALPVRIVGDTPGTASMLKMLLGGVSKGLCGLFAELGAAAHRGGLSTAFVEECERYYPGVLEALQRLMPTVPRHAARRADEMAELAAAMTALDLRPGFARATQNVLAAIASGSMQGLETTDLKVLLTALAERVSWPSPE